MADATMEGLSDALLAQLAARAQPDGSALARPGESAELRRSDSLVRARPASRRQRSRSNVERTPPARRSLARRRTGG